ncbi:hypothetical protein [Ralstonia phage phiRSL1]|uniref:Putative metallopeptidase domain-containing protein n=1 Tax=Ralstonia phage phiRSL1 TaxID=1980924 RepID=B2ZXW1_9CAUD|nr:hypothetical protein RSL1_ORF092 [Ralstonia phage phiRSL1]BAG41537.1 hypothetical protein [Ralstonia phage phiRSL1]
MKKSTQDRVKSTAEYQKEFQELVKAVRNVSVPHFYLLDDSCAAFTEKGLAYVTGSYTALQFVWNKKYWDAMNLEERIFDLLHMCQHLLSGHYERMKPWLSGPTKDAAELAMELAANHTVLRNFALDPKRMPLLGSRMATVHNTLPELELSDSLSLEEYFFLLNQAQSNAQACGGQSEESDEDEESTPVDGQAQGKGQKAKGDTPKGSKKQENDDESEDEDGEEDGDGQSSGSEQSDDSDEDGEQHEQPDAGDGQSDDDPDPDEGTEDRGEQQDEREEGEDASADAPPPPKPLDSHGKSGVSPELLNNLLAHVKGQLEYREDQMDGEADEAMAKAFGRTAGTGDHEAEPMEKTPVDIDAQREWRKFAYRLERSLRKKEGATSWLPNKRYVALGLEEAGLCMPAYTAPRKSHVKAVVFLDTSASCDWMRTPFFTILTSIPKEIFEVATYTFTTKVHPFNPKAPRFHRGGTSFNGFEKVFDAEVAKDRTRNVKHYAFVITDGEVCQIFSPKNPADWWFIMLRPDSLAGRLGYTHHDSKSTTKWLNPKVNVMDLHPFLNPKMQAELARGVDIEW